MVNIPPPRFSGSLIHSPICSSNFSGINFSEESGAMNLDVISDAAEKSLIGYLTTYLNKTTQQFKCDIDYFYNHAKHNFLTIQEWKNYDWAFRYQNAKFDINVDARVYYSLLNSD